MSSTDNSVFFNSLSLLNDLEGRLAGSVLITQSTILPSRASKISGDIQPRMISYRDAMVMFKPLSASNNFVNGIQLNVIGNDNRVIFSTHMKDPSQLTEPVEKIDVDESKFIEKAPYDHIIQSQSEFDKMNGDISGSHLSSLLEKSSTIKIVTSDGNFLKEIHLPEKILSQSGKLITFEREATYASTIYYEGKKIEAKHGAKLYFKNVNGVWNTPSDLPYSEVVSVFAEPEKYDHTVSSQKEISDMGNDPNATYFNHMLTKYKTIKISLSDGNWEPKFYLPENKPSQNGGVIAFHSNAGYSANVDYCGTSLTLNRGQSLVFINNNGVWAEWSDSQYKKIGYGQRFWSGVIPWQYIFPGVSLQFQANSFTGVYTAPDIGAPGELLIHTVDIGMLTPNRQAFSFQYDEDYHRQYFQQIPASRLIINKYEPVFWKEIMLPDGKLYKDHSADKGDVYEGDLRQIIGKELISLGINNANYGIHSSPGIGESGLNNRFAAAQLTAHNSVGNYINGRVVHGLSGGAGIVTLVNSVGNEFSHEVGHNCGLGHNPNGFNGSVHRSAENINSTWGWDSKKNVFIPNFAKAQSGENTCYDAKCQPPFNGHQFGTDAMAGGAPLYSSTNAYTLYTPYSHFKIQNFLEEKAVFDRNSSTGFTKWNEHTKSMEEWAEFYGAQPTEVDNASMVKLLEKYTLIEVSQWDGHYSKDIYIPQASSINKSRGIKIVNNSSYNSTLHVNGGQVMISQGSVFNYESDGSKWYLVDDFSFNVVRKPHEHGVPVTTILGYYDPEKTLPSYIYPSLHGAYGNTFHSDKDNEIHHARCYAEVMNNKGQTLKFVLRSIREETGKMNRLHVNVATSFSPTVIKIYSEGSVIVSKSIQTPTTSLRFTINGRQ